MNVHVLLNGIMVRPWTRPWSVIHGLWPWSKSVVKAAKSMVQTMDSDHGQRPWSLTMMPFNKTWLSMDYHGLVPLDIHGYPWTSMVKMSLIRLGCSPNPTKYIASKQWRLMKVPEIGEMLNVLESIL